MCKFTLIYNALAVLLFIFLGYTLVNSLVLKLQHMTTAHGIAC